MDKSAEHNGKKDSVHQRIHEAIVELDEASNGVEHEDNYRDDQYWPKWAHIIPPFDLSQPACGASGMRFIHGGPDSSGKRILFTHVRSRYSVAVIRGATEMVNTRSSVCPNNRVTRAMRSRSSFGGVLVRATRASGRYRSWRRPFAFANIWF